MITPERLEQIRERVLAIDAEWLLSIGFERGIGETYNSPSMKVWRNRDGSFAWWTGLWLPPMPQTRGEVIDWLQALKIPTTQTTKGQNEP